MKICKLRKHKYEGRQCKECAMLWRAANKLVLTAKKKAYDEANRSQSKARRKQNREAYLVSQKKYREMNRPKRTALEIKRQCNKLQRTPKWLNAQHFKQIELFYEAAASLSKEFCIQMDVDHIVPLQGKEVSGLHVPWNLQVIPHEDNMSKGNR